MYTHTLESPVFRHGEYVNSLNQIMSRVFKRADFSAWSVEDKLSHLSVVFDTVPIWTKDSIPEFLDKIEDVLNKVWTDNAWEQAERLVMYHNINFLKSLSIEYKYKNCRQR